MEGKYGQIQFRVENWDCFQLMSELIAKKQKFRLIILDLPYCKTQNAWEIPIPLDKLWLYLIPLLD